MKKNKLVYIYYIYIINTRIKLKIKKNEKVIKKNVWWCEMPTWTT